MPFQKGKSDRAPRESYPSAGAMLTPWLAGRSPGPPGARAAAAGWLELGGSAGCRQKAGAARRVPGPICALPPLPGEGGATRGRGVSRSQRSRPPVGSLGGQNPSQKVGTSAPKLSNPVHGAEVEKWAPGRHWKQKLTATSKA